MVKPDDIALIRRILDGDTAGYSVLVNQYKDMAFTLAYRIAGRREDAEEVVQDSFVKAFRGLSSFKQQAKFSTWLYRIVYNTAVSKKRLKGPAWQSLDGIKLIEAIPDSENEEANRGNILEKAMLHLTAEERSILTLYYIEESSVGDIHEITGLSRSNVKIKLFRARKKLQEVVRKLMIPVYGY